ncbi:hypothetical protein CMI37_13305 [Candidatus Pacearchaeota archaeon]|nr:hypothetical protein [Candidatus Pacearchaeota archaeon]
MLDKTEISNSLEKSNSSTIDEEYNAICQTQITKTFKVLSRKLIEANDRAIMELGTEPLWSLKDLGIQCESELRERGLLNG